jgi:hypothetical protein
MNSALNDVTQEIENYIKKYKDLTDAINYLVNEAKEKGYNIPSIYQRSLQPNHIDEEVYTLYEEIKTSSINDTKRKIETIYADYDIRYGSNWGWCSLNKAGCIIDCINEICLTTQDPVCVEIGVYGGKSVIPVVLELQRLQKGKMYAIDPWDNIEATKGYDGEHYNFWSSVDLNNIYSLFTNLLLENKCQDLVEIIMKPSDDAPEIDNINFLYIDGQHTEQAIRDVHKYASKVLVNGYCVVDDINRDVWGEVSTQTPAILESMGFQAQRSIDDAIIFKRISVQ